MKSFNKLYQENASWEMLVKKEEQGKLNALIREFINEMINGTYIKNEVDFKLDTYRGNFPWCKNEVGYKWNRNVKVWDGPSLASYVVNDYSFVETCGVVLDYSDKWVGFMLEHLEGKEKEEYLQGLQQFADKIAQSVKSQILEPVKIQLNKTNNQAIDAQPEKRLIEQQIENNAEISKGKTTVIKPEVSEKDVEEVIESVRKHDTIFGL